jgi:hypothetical protein
MERLRVQLLTLKYFHIFIDFCLIVPLQIFAVLRLYAQCLSLPLYCLLQCLPLKNSNSSSSVIVICMILSRRQVFGEKTEDGRIIKRLADDDSDEEIHRPSVKVLKTSNPTDLLCALPGGAKNKKVNPLVRVKSQKTGANNADSTNPVAAVPASSNAAGSSSSGSSVAAPAKTLGLSLLGAYSDSDSDN